MSRRGQYGRRLEFYTHPKYGGEVPIYIDRVGVFSAVIGDVVLQNENKTELTKLVIASLKNQSALEWKPMIEIAFGYHWRDRDEKDPSDRNIEVELKYERFWYAQQIDSKFIEADWDEKAWKEGRMRREIGDRLARSKRLRICGERNRHTGEVEQITSLKLPRTEHEDDNRMPKYYVEYTEELWTALDGIAERMEGLQKQLVKILGSEKTRAMLTQQIGKLLPAPPMEKTA